MEMLSMNIVVAYSLWLVPVRANCTLSACGRGIIMRCHPLMPLWGSAGVEEVCSVPFSSQFTVAVMPWPVPDG